MGNDRRCPVNIKEANILLYSLGTLVVGNGSHPSQEDIVSPLPVGCLLGLYAALQSHARRGNRRSDGRGEVG